jgi:dTDP-4-dehydrorhamnose 3,5-epimerase
MPKSYRLITVQTLADDCELIYLHSAAHQPAAESGLNPHDPALAIAWPRTIGDISAKDAERPMIHAHFEGIVL